MADFELYRCRIAKYTGEEFLDRMPKLCKELHTKLGVLTFAFILYDDSTPNFRKMLRDSDYWDALDKASGDNMVVFTLKDERKQEVKTTIDMLTAFSGTSRDKTKSHSRLLKTIFGSDALPTFPSVLLFQVVGTEIQDYRLVPVSRGTVSESAARLQELFKAISGVLTAVEEQFYGNQRQIFELVKNELLNRKFRMLIFRGPKLLADFIDAVRNLTFT